MLLTKTAADALRPGAGRPPPHGYSRCQPVASAAGRRRGAPAMAPAESPLVILIVSQRCSQVTCQHWRLPTSLINLRVDHKSSSFVSSFLSVGSQFSWGSACQLIKLVHPRLMSLLTLPGRRSFTFGNHEGKHNVTASVTGEEYFNGHDNLQNKNQQALVNTKYPRCPVMAARL